MRFAFCHFLWAVLGGLLGSLPTHTLRAQSFDLPAPQRLTEREGLPQAFISAIVQDRQGFIWAATRDGLCRYDGQQFKVFQPDPNGRASLSYAGISKLTLDHHGRIWITSERGDLDVFNPKTEAFINISRQPAFQKVLKGRGFSFFLFDRQERLWIVASTSAEVVRYDFRAGKTKSPPAKGFFFKQDSSGYARRDTITDVAEGADGRIWLTTVTGLRYLDPKTDRFRKYPLPPRPAGAEGLPPRSSPRRIYARSGEICC